MAQVFGEGFEHVVQPVAYIAHTEAGAFTDFLVAEIVVIFQPNQAAVALRHLGEQEPNQANRFVSPEHFCGQRALGFSRFLGQLGFLGVIPQVIEREISQAAVQPAARVFHVGPDFVQAQKCFLNQFLCHHPPADQADGIAQQPTFLSLKQLPDAGWF